MKFWPWWAWLVIFVLALHVAQFLAWLDMKRERDAEAQRIDKAIEKAVAAERERCAKIVETCPMPSRWQGDPLTGYEVRAIIAAAIRKG